MAWTPAEVTELVKVVLYGMAILCVPAATFITMIVRLKAITSNMELLEKNTNSISERNEAIAKKLGITEGIAQERASVQAHAAAPPQAVPLPLGGPSTVNIKMPPLPVADDRTATATEQTAAAAKDTAAASERSATATERMADAAEEVSKKG